jgi:mannose-6-phosphate isomerase-like protein (cupin superfamily)
VTAPHSSHLSPPRVRALDESQGRRATWLGLFFDLVFVVAVATLGRSGLGPIEVELDHTEIILVLSGTGQLEVDGGAPLELTPGRAARIDVGAHTRWMVDQEFTELWLYVETRAGLVVQVLERTEHHMSPKQRCITQPHRSADIAQANQSSHGSTYDPRPSHLGVRKADRPQNILVPACREGLRGTSSTAAEGV